MVGGFSGIQYTSYYYINRIIKDTKFDSKLIEAFAGTFSVSITYPTDLVRRRLHQGFDKSVQNIMVFLTAVIKYSN